MSNYAAKSDLRKATSVDISQLTKKYDLANLKSKLDELNINKLAQLDADKLKYVPVYLRKFSDIVDKKVDVYYAKIKAIEDKIPNITTVATTTALNAKINKIKNEILSITNLTTNTPPNVKIDVAKGKIPGIM